MSLVFSSKYYLFFPVAFPECEQLRVVPLFSCTHRSPRCWKHSMTSAKTALTLQWKGSFISRYQLPFHSTAPSHCLTGRTMVTPRALKILLFPKEACFIKGKKKIIRTARKTQNLFFQTVSWLGLLYFFLFPLAEETFQNTWWEKQIVLGVKAPARPQEDLIWFPAQNEVNRPEHCVCDLPLDHPAAEQIEVEFCHRNSWLCTPKT